MREYKYCPFCGGTPHLFSVQGIHRVDCDHCDMEGPLGSSPEDAIKRYNTRAKTPIEAAAKAVDWGWIIEQIKNEGAPYVGALAALKAAVEEK
jgi:hypothetical protein